MTTRYEIRLGNHPDGKFGVWDHLLSVWQVFKLLSYAEAWIAKRLREEDGHRQRPSTFKIRLPK